MGNFLLGFKALFRIWQDDAFAGIVQRAFTGVPEETVAPARTLAPATPAEPVVAAPFRSDALTLLGVLQREARLVDFMKEPITGYSDAEIGAAVRSLHKDASATLERIFGLEPLTSQPEGASLEAPAGFDPAQFRLVGNVPPQPPFRGKIVHPGWKATRCELPSWTGREDAELVVAPLELQF